MCGREVILPTNPEIADSLGDVYLDFDNCILGYVVGFQIPRFTIYSG